MKAKFDKQYNWIVTEGADRYNETEAAMPTSRVLDGSSDHGYWAEYIGRGTIDGVPVKAIYLLDYDQSEIEDEDYMDWDKALGNGRLVVDVDKLSDDDYNKLVKTGELSL